eukprot:TRINITY_DN23744_c0_g5_i2.p1 TRINITY_DN23744_c0_g5~~TRINITY_DN23744_c0_g5_i2.p1  ORF type:complete len:566 (+),score=76.50 TRINITY_DN23744_c0_g5_i2:88-1785(+)
MVVNIDGGGQVYASEKTHSDEEEQETRRRSVCSVSKASCASTGSMLSSSMEHARRKFLKRLSVTNVCAVSRSKSDLTIDYIRRENVESTLPGMRQHVRKFLENATYDVVLGLMIFFNFVIICIDIDYRTRAEETPAWINITLFLCFAVYCVDWCARFYVERCVVFTNVALNVDLTIIVIGVIEYIIAAVFDSTDAAQTSWMIRLLRMLRLLRLLRVMKLFRALRELRKLLQMMVSCAKTLFWSFALCFILLTIWAAIGVQMLDDIVRLVDEEGGFADCERCGRAFSSVMTANLTLFQIVMVGDAWGEIAIPMIERYPASAIIFVGSVLTLLFGVVNLILAVVVDSFAETKKHDMKMLATELDLLEEAEKHELSSIFDRIDSDGDGVVTFDELHDGAKQVEELRQWLRVLDIDSKDLRCLFDILDQTQSGGVSCEEFKTVVYRMKNTESKTAVKLIKSLTYAINDRVASIQKEMNLLSSNIKKIGLRQTRDQSFVESGRRHTSPHCDASLEDTRGSGIQRSKTYDSFSQEAVHSGSTCLPDSALSPSHRESSDISSYVSPSFSVVV